VAIQVSEEANSREVENLNSGSGRAAENQRNSRCFVHQPARLRNSTAAVERDNSEKEKKARLANQ